jgi:hypothetical protein
MAASKSLPEGPADGVEIHEEGDGLGAGVDLS